MQIMLSGEYEYNLDPKRRLAIPAKLRNKLGDQVVVTRGLDQCLFVYPLKVWEELAEKLSQLPTGQGQNRGFVRLLFSSASEVGLDSLGRILIPESLKEYADLKKEVIMVGALNRLEIWDREKWMSFKTLAEKEIGNVAEKLGELGIY